MASGSNSSQSRRTVTTASVVVVLLDGENITQWMVQQGDAGPTATTSTIRGYCAWEATARASQRGLWSLPPGSRVAPWNGARLGAAYRWFHGLTAAEECSELRCGDASARGVPARL